MDTINLTLYIVYTMAAVFAIVSLIIVFYSERQKNLRSFHKQKLA